MEFQIKEFQVPVIKINFDELKAELESNLKDYEGLVVTEETLTGCKAAAKELSSVRRKVDQYRKDKKKEAEKPIKEFESQCKTLISLIEEVEKPIKEGIQVFDDKKREENRVMAESIIAEVVESTGLNEKYGKRLTVIDKYMNLTATQKAVREDAETRAFALKVEQDRENERIDIIQGVIDSENSRINTKLSMDEFRFMIDSDFSTSVILEEIKNKATKIYEAENKPKEEPQAIPEAQKVPETQETPAEPQKPVQEAPEQQYTATIKLFGTAEQLRSVSQFIRDHGISYKVLEQKKIH